MEKYLPFAPYITTIVTALIAVFGFGFSVWRYVDTRYREEKRRNYENFLHVMSVITKLAHPENVPVTAEIIFAINQLKMKEFNQYSQIIIPNLVYLRDIPPQYGHKETENLVINSINTVIKELGLEKYAGQFATSGSANPPRNDNPSMAGEAYKPTAVGSQ